MCHDAYTPFAYKYICMGIYTCELQMRATRNIYIYIYIYHRRLQRFERERCPLGGSIRVYIHKYIHTCKYMYTHTFTDDCYSWMGPCTLGSSIHIYKHVNLYIYIYTCTHMNMHTHTFTDDCYSWMWRCALCNSIRVYMHTCKYLYMYIYTCIYRQLLL